MGGWTPLRFPDYACVFLVTTFLKICAILSPMTKNNVPNRTTPPWRRLKAWHVCEELDRAALRVSRNWPLEDQDLIGSDLRNSAARALGCIMLSTRNVSPKRAFGWLDEACGKLGRIDALLHIARDAKLISVQRYGEVENLRRRASWLTSALRPRVERRTKGVRVNRHKGGRGSRTQSAA